MNQWQTNWRWMKGHVTWLPEHFAEIQDLAYMREKFNDPEQMQQWQNRGFTPRVGFLYDMRYEEQPALTQKIISYMESQGLDHVGVSYYRMDKGDNLPYHSDLYKKYISLFNLEAVKQNIVRYILFPEDRKPGHIFEIDGTLVDWRAGDWVAWRYDTPHMAANFGYDDRYTIQVTGVLRESL